MLKAIVWRVRSRAHHVENGWVQAAGKERRVAAIIDENRNPLKARGSPPLARPITLELYFPLPQSVDRVQKFTSPESARREAAKQLERFVGDCLES